MEWEDWCTDPSALRHLFTDNNKSINIQLEDLLSSFLSKQRSLLRDSNGKHEGRIRIGTRKRGHMSRLI